MEIFLGHWKTLLLFRNYSFRFLWLFVIVIDLLCLISLVADNWNRFETNPSVVSLEKDFRNWNNIFPGHTFCIDDKVDKKKMKEYILQ